MQHHHNMIFPPYKQSRDNSNHANYDLLTDYYSDNSKYDNRFEVIVKGLNPSYKEFQIAEIFSYFGEVARVKIEKNPDGSSKGSCFIAFTDYNSVMRAVQMNKIVFNN